MTEYIEIGYTCGVVGIKGQLRAKLDVFDIQEYKKQKELFLAERGSKNLVPYRVLAVEIRSDSEMVILLEGIDSREKAADMVGYTLYLHESKLPKLRGNKFYYFEVIGFTIQDENLGTLGTITNIFDMPAQDIIAMNYQNKEVLIPITDEFILQPDRENRILHTRLPEGLVEVYLES